MPVFFFLPSRQLLYGIGHVEEAWQGWQWNLTFGKGSNRSGTRLEFTTVLLPNLNPNIQYDCFVYVCHHRTPSNSRDQSPWQRPGSLHAATGHSAGSSGEEGRRRVRLHTHRHQTGEEQHRAARPHRIRLVDYSWRHQTGSGITRDVIKPVLASVWDELNALWLVPSMSWDKKPRHF